MPVDCGVAGVWQPQLHTGEHPQGLAEALEPHGYAVCENAGLFLDEGLGGCDAVTGRVELAASLAGEGTDAAIDLGVVELDAGFESAYGVDGVTHDHGDPLRRLS